MTSNSPFDGQLSATSAWIRKTLDSEQARALTKANAIVLASTSSAVVSVVAGYPFDLIKTRMQAFRYPSNMACIKEIYVNDGGMVGFFRGMGPILVTVSFLRSVSFSVYTSTKPFLIEQFNNQPPLSLSSFQRQFPFQLPQFDLPALSLPSVPTMNVTSILPSEWQAKLEAIQSPNAVQVASSVLAGSAAGTIVATINAPVEFIKIQRQLESKMLQSFVSSSSLERMVESSAGAVASGTAGGLGEGAALASRKVDTSFYRPLTAWEWARKIVNQKGFIGLYSGYSYHLLRDFTGTGMYFGGYESLKVLFTSKGETAGPMVHMMAGGLSGTLSWIILYPIDLIKSVMQKEAMQPIPKYSSAGEFISRRYRKGGIRGFYHGIGAQLMRSFPVHAMNFLIYEAVLKWCRR
ncbi:mitochondrial carrier domain-containing protein [Chytriomyces cf. hyalinus JEL632]|nr:mitochondrial carrier domain-containing protein [Chytriomyces cf. hyalinus JEL632]